MRCMTVITAAGALVVSLVAGCGDDDPAAAGDPVSTEEFCDLLVELREESESEELDLEIVDRIIAAAPAELSDDLQVVRDAVAELEGFDEDDPEAFEALMPLMFDEQITGAFERVAEWGVEKCGIDPGDDDLGDDSDGDSEASAAGDTEMPDDVGLVREPALIITWDEVDDAFNYRIEIDGRTVDTTFGDRYVAVNADTGDDVVVEALEMGDGSLGPAPNVQAVAGEALVVVWTEVPGGTYYVEWSGADAGRMATIASSPFVIDVPADEVEGVRFGPGLLVTDDDGRRIDSPFNHGDEHWVELDIP